MTGAGVAASRGSSSAQVAQLVLRYLEEGKSVDIDGLGVFRREGRSYRFTPRSRPRVFLAYVAEDRDAADRLFENLDAKGLAPWLDRRKLLPGQNWPRAIDEAIETSDF